MAIIKHNKLIETSYKLNSREQFFVLYLISQISQNQGTFTEYRMHYSEIERIINFDGKRRLANKSEVFALMDKLNSVPIIYEKGSIVGKSVWLQHVEHDTETDEFSFSISEKLREYLMQLKEHFTKYSISNIVYLNGNAIRLYEVLKRHQYKGECEISVEKLKFYLGIEDKYPKFYEFKRWVLIPSQKEIEQYTDIRFEFRPAKKERKRILSLKFYIFENEPKYTPEMIRLLTGLEEGRIGEDQQLAPSEAPLAVKLPAQLSAFQQQAYRFLLDKGVNKRFITEKILTHPKVNYAPLRGYEDLYVKILWNFFASKTKADKKAGAFVSWWKNGRLTEDGLHARMVETVLERSKVLSQAERDARSMASKREADALNLFDDFSQRTTALNNFNIVEFRQQHPEIHQHFSKQVEKDYRETLEASQQTFDINKYQKSIDHQVYHKCKAWLQVENEATKTKKGKPINFR